MNRILLTGATGLIGRQALALLAGRGCEVHAVTRRPRAASESPSPSACWHEVDLLDEDAVRAVIREVKADGLLHLAWATGAGGYDDGVHRAWLDAGRVLIRAFHEAGGKRVVVAGTCFEYDWTDGVCCEERTALAPSTLYAACKDALRQFLEGYCEDGNFGWGWGRVFFVYGPHELPRRLVPSIIISLLKGEPARCTHGRQVRDYLHSRDVAAGLLALFDSGWNGTCNIGSGERVTLREIGDAIGERLGGRSLLEFGARPAPESEPPVILADVKRLGGRIGWRPEIGLAAGLEETIEWWRQELAAPAVSRSL